MTESRPCGLCGEEKLLMTYQSPLLEAESQQSEVYLCLRCDLTGDGDGATP